MKDYARPLSCEDKDEIARESIGIVRWVVRKYQNRRIYFDINEVEEMEGWGFLGLAKAINEYEEKPHLSFSSIAFDCVRKEILENFMYRDRKKDISLNRMTANDDNEEREDIDFVESEGLYYDVDDIVQMVDEALTEEPILFKKVNVDFLIEGKEVAEICSEYKISKNKFDRILSRGRNLIKLYLSVNDIISDHDRFTWLVESQEDNSHEKGKRDLDKSVIAKIKYINRHFKTLNVQDIATILEVSYYAVKMLLDYPTISFYKTPLDDSIHEKAYAYQLKKYPHKINGEVTIKKIAELNRSS